MTQYKTVISNNNIYHAIYSFKVCSCLKAGVCKLLLQEQAVKYILCSPDHNWNSRPRFGLICDPNAERLSAIFEHVYATNGPVESCLASLLPVWSLSAICSIEQVWVKPRVKVLHTKVPEARVITASRVVCDHNDKLAPGRF